MNLNNVKTLEQTDNILIFSQHIVSLLDDEALKELTGGYDSDIDNVLAEIESITDTVLYGNNTGKIKTSFNYLEKYSKSLNEAYRIADINYFAIDVVPTFEQEWFHLEWGRLINNFQYLCIIAPRDHGKTWFFSFLYSLWKLYRFKRGTILTPMEKHIALSERGMLISSGTGLASTLLGYIKNEIEQNDILREKLFNKTVTWGAYEITTANGANLKVGSYGKNMRGFHPGWAAVDDFHEEKDLYSKEQNKKKINFFNGVLRQMVHPEGQINVIGTPFSDIDLYSTLKKKSKWKVFEYPAIDPNGIVLHPNRYNLKKLIERKEEIGSTLFSREILCKPISSESSLFPYSLLETSFIGMENYMLVPNIHSFKQNNFVKISIGADFAKSANVGSDATVYTVIAEDNLEHIWLLYVWRKVGATYNEQINVLMGLNQDFSPDIIMLETNGFQQIYYEQLKQAGLPVFASPTGNEKKSLEVGIPSLQVYFEQRKIHFPRGDMPSKEMTDLLCRELSSISWTDKGLQGVGDHDDMPMSLWKAIRGLKQNTFNFEFI